MTDVQSVKDRIFSAWDYHIEPLRYRVTCSNSEEGQALIAAFGSVRDWRALSPEFLDNAPDGMTSALSFFSDDALQYFIAGYLIADLDQKLVRAEPYFSLTRGFDYAAYGSRDIPKGQDIARWRDLKPSQVIGVVGYLEWIYLTDIGWADQIQAALNSYWYPRSRQIQ